MNEPTRKAPGLIKLFNELNTIDGKPTDRDAAIKAAQCSRCRKPVIEFRDRLSEKEYFISGWCQSCQDLMFKPINEDDDV